MGQEKWIPGLSNICQVMPLCLLSFICPCLTQGISAWEISKTGGCGECLISCCCCCIGMSLNREKFRNHYEIEGNCISDCICFSCCYYSCMVTQEYLHITMHNKSLRNN